MPISIEGGCMMKYIKVEALDTVLFRDGTPFNNEHDMWASSIFPPSPRTLWGMLRAIYFSRHPDDLKLVGTNADPTLEIRIKSISYYIIDNGDSEFLHYFPLPRDLAILRGTEEVFPMKIRAIQNAATSCPTSHSLILGERGKLESPDRVFIDHNNLKTYLSGQHPSKVTQIKKRILNEPKIGIKIDCDTGTTEESMIYQSRMLRIDGISIVIGYEGIELANEGLIQIGGERRAGYFKHIDNEINLESPKKEATYARIYLSTPAVFNGGWCPSFVDESSLECSFDDSSYKLVAAAVGKYGNIGGYDIKSGMPMHMYRVVPSGSVYYFKLLKGTWHSLFDYIHTNSISDIWKSQGFGISYMGVI
jgi:CRISPR-associated protein Cmr3